MKRSLLAVVAPFLLVLLCGFAAPTAAAISGYTLVDLASGQSSFATGLNDRGDVIGYAYDSAGEHAFIWSNGVVRDIGVPPGTSHFIPSAINDRGRLVGQDLSGKIWTWQDGAWVDMGLVGQPEGIDHSDVIVGYTAASGGAVSGFVLRDGVLTIIDTFGGRDSYALALNDRGQVAGYAALPDGSQHAFVWDSGTMTDLGTFEGHGTGANGINSHGEVIGEAFDNNVYYGGWIYEGTMQPIGGTSPVLFPRGLNDRAVVVGEVSPPGNVPAPWPAGSFIYEDGVVTRLDQLPAFAGYTQVSALKINNRGWIVGHAVRDGVPHAFVLIPVHGNGR